MYSDRRIAISKSTNKRNRQRYLVNVFTRMRFLSRKNKLDLKTKTKKTHKDKYQPWFNYQHKCLKDIDNIVFGHWAAINGVTNHSSIKGIDLGCVWGGSLAAINLLIIQLLPLTQSHEDIQGWWSSKRSYYGCKT